MVYVILEGENVIGRPPPSNLSKGSNCTTKNKEPAAHWHFFHIILRKRSHPQYIIHHATQRKNEAGTCNQPVDGLRIKKTFFAAGEESLSAFFSSISPPPPPSMRGRRRGGEKILHCYPAPKKKVLRVSSLAERRRLVRPWGRGGRKRKR